MKVKIILLITFEVVPKSDKKKKDLKNWKPEE